MGANDAEADPSRSAGGEFAAGGACETDPSEADRLLPLVYDELRRVARAQLEALPPGQTLQPTALVHEAYLRLVGKELTWDGPAHFFFTAARAMHDILVERARQKASLKGGGGWVRLDLNRLVLPCDAPSEQILALSEAMSELERAHPRKHQVAFLRFFAGCTHEETAAALGLSPGTVAREWLFARAWLYERLANGGEADKEDDEDVEDDEHEA
jgi:RNA polymerase sigma factor (TIGR02999 family)